MDADTKKTALRMIPYGLYVLTAKDDEGNVAAATVNWVTQASFQPPLIVVGVRADSFIHSLIENSHSFALNVLGKDQGSLAFTFFKPAVLHEDTMSGEPFRSGKTGSPLLESTAAFVECKVVEVVKIGDHSIFIGEVVEVGVKQQPDGRPDEVTLWLKDLGPNIFYGG
ncbi:MAG: flavin reductase [Chloroflexi bacterium RBG_16_48_8]|nr:MAG: flavin reductase [Chloroflexi bacterium RBG_16_48_8]